MKIKKILAAALLAAGSLQMHADEGMWMLNRIDQKTADIMKGLGLTLTPAELYNPDGVSLKDAVVDFGDFCSGVVVSPNGLVFTNHHCGFGAIQALSTPQDDILANGFVARNMQEERPAEGLFVRFLQSTEECTSRIMTALDSIYRANPTVPAKEINNTKTDSICSAVEREYSRANPGMDCMVRSYYGGNAFYVSKYKTYRDVRLVFTATQTLGKFGGDTDNWMWPRQTCDFSMFRIYADKNGEPAEYSKDNVPLKPKRYAKVSIDGYRPGDYCMTVGYPGSTSRYLSSWGIRERVEDRNVSTIQVRGKKQEVWKKWMDADRAIGIKYASKYAGSSNYWKNSIGMNKAIVDNKVVETKLIQEAAFKLWAKKNGKNEYVNVIEEINACVEEMNRTMYLSTATMELIMNVEFIYRNLIDDNKTMFNDSSKVERTMKNIYAWLHERDYVHEIDRRIAKEVLPLYFKLTEAEERDEYRNEVYAKYNGNLEEYIDYVYDNSILANEKNLNKFLQEPTLQKFEEDPGMQLRTAVFRSYRKIMAKSAEFEKVINPLHKTYLKGLMEMANGAPVYPDANFTMRMTYGNVKPYQPKDGVTYNYYTTLKGVMEKEDPNNSEFIVPARLKELYEAKDFGQYAMANGEMPVAFLTTNDITGGNSGSGVLNGNGELIGLAFDGNWESLSGDINFDDNLQRCINVDIRYVLFVIEKLGNCKRIIDEMNIVR